MALTKKQKLFIKEYLIDLNATQAAIRAGYSPDSAADIGSENLRKPDICASIDKAMAERSRRLGLNQDRILLELAKIALLNPQDIGSENLRKPDICASIDKAMAERSRRLGLNQDRILLELAKIALLNPQQVVNLNDATIREDALPEDLAAVASVKVKRFPTKEGEGIEREIKFYDKSKALELAGKHLGMFRDKVDVNVQTSEKLDDIMSQLGGEGLEE